MVVFSKMAQSDTLSHVIQEDEDTPAVPKPTPLPEPTPVPVKRGRGRPPKSKDAASRAPGAQPSDQLKRGRGRPRKNPDAPPQPKGDLNAPKRSPGRPRKDPSKPVDPNAPKRAKDPKKDSAQEALAPDDHDTASSTDPSAQPSEDGVKKRNPGRPKKDDSGARKVGRPRKRPLEVAAGEENATAEEAPARRRRGRPPKKAAAANPTQPEAEDGTWKPFHLHVSFEESSSETEQPNAATAIAALASGNGELAEKPREHRESSETSYSTPEPEVEP